MSEVFKGVPSKVAKRAGNAFMANVALSTSHSPAGWPTIEESFDVNAMSRRLDFAIKTLEPIDSPGNSYICSYRLADHDVVFLAWTWMLQVHS